MFFPIIRGRKKRFWLFKVVQSKDCLTELLSLDITDLVPCVFCYGWWKPSKHQHSIKSFIARMDIICTSESCDAKADWSRIVLLASLMGPQSFLMFTIQKCITGKQYVLEGFWITSMGVKAQQGSCGPPFSLSVIQLTCPHFHSLFSLDLLPFSPNWWRILSFPVSCAMTQGLCIHKHMATYVSTITH